MQIVCPECAASYRVADAAMGDGRVVRCTNCGHVWRATAADAVAAAGADTPSRAVAPADQAAAKGTAGAAGSSESAAVTSAAEPGAVPGESTDFFATAGDSEENDALAEAPSLVPDADAASSAEAEGTIIDADRGEDDAFAQRRAARRKREAQRRRGRGPSWTTTILALMAIIAAILAFRTQVVSAMPQTAELFAKIGLPVNLRGLVFHQVKVEKEQVGDVTALIVQGSIVNVRRRLIEVPRLRFSLRDAAGAEVYHWTVQPGQRVLGPGDVLPFRTRLASPPPQGEDIVVRFFSRFDR